MAVGDAYVFPGFLTPVLAQLFFPKPPTTFLTCFCRGERRKYAGKIYVVNCKLEITSSFRKCIAHNPYTTLHPFFAHTCFYENYRKLSIVRGKFAIVIDLEKCHLPIAIASKTIPIQR